MGGVESPALASLREKTCILRVGLQGSTLGWGPSWVTVPFHFGSMCPLTVCPVNRGHTSQEVLGSLWLVD